MLSQDINYCYPLTDKQMIAVGSLSLKRRMNGMGDAKFKKYLAVLAIKVQTYF